MSAVQHQLDYPGINCRQCGDNAANDEIEPGCETCPVNDWDQLTRQILALYDKCAPWDRLEPALIGPALDILGFAARDRRPARECLLSIHRHYKQYQQQQQQQGQSTP
jgi:hypothetical protein